MIAEADSHAVIMDLAEGSPSDDEPAVAASARERRAALVAEPDPGSSHRRQQPALVESLRAYFYDLTAGLMQHLVLVEDNPGCLGEPLESTVSADHGAIADCRPDIAHPLERHREPDSCRIVGAEDGAGGRHVADDKTGARGQQRRRYRLVGEILGIRVECLRAPLRKCGLDQCLRNPRRPSVITTAQRLDIEGASEQPAPGEEPIARNPAHRPRWFPEKAFIH